jgi:hypothetical protein
VSLPSLVGALCSLEKRGFLKGIESYSSSGNGCFVSVLLCAGLSLAEMKRKLASSRNIFYDSHSYQYFEPDVRGTDQYISLGEFFSTIFRDRFSFIPTFDDLFSLTGKLLVLTTYDVTNDKVLYLSKETHPQMSVLTAIKLTTGVSHFTCDVNYGGNLHVDASSCLPCPLPQDDSHTIFLGSVWKRSVEKIFPNTKHGQAQLLLNISIKRLTKGSLKGYSGKVLKIVVKLGSDAFSREENVAFVESFENCLIEGYNQIENELKNNNS